MSPRLQQRLLSLNNASSITASEVLQELWSGYGKILRLTLDDGSTVIAKHIRLPSKNHHPRGWNTDHSHQRKVKSYQVETAWYQNWSARCDHSCRIPKLLAFDQIDDEILLVLEDLDAAGFPKRNLPEIKSCLRWLAHFHATFMGEKPDRLWEIGTYWHLDTRPDEWSALEPGPLKDSAKAIDQKLKQATYQTLVHGDAKLANFCFSESGDQVAAVDFQYVGGGCGMKDVAYLIGSCLHESECDARETELLDFYFQKLRTALAEKQPTLNAQAIITEWRTLFPLAWTDFHRFLKGWSPGHWKLTSYSEKIAHKVTQNTELGL